MLIYNRKAFTIIELIFVIVIIGLLSAVALPKLTATRDDTQIVRIIDNIKQIISDTQSYYTAQGRDNYVHAKIPEVISVALYLNTNCSSYGSMTFVGSTSYLCAGNTAIVQILTTDITQDNQAITLKAYDSSSPLYQRIKNNKLFQRYTNGTTGRKYIIGSSKVTP